MMRALALALLAAVFLPVLVAILRVLGRKPWLPLLARSFPLVGVSTRASKQEACGEKRAHQDAMKEDGGTRMRHAKPSTARSRATARSRGGHQTRAEGTSQMNTYPYFKTVDGDEVLFATDHEGALREILSSLGHLGHLMRVHPEGLSCTRELGAPAAAPQHRQLRCLLQRLVIHRAPPIVPVSLPLTVRAQATLHTWLHTWRSTRHAACGMCHAMRPRPVHKTPRHLMMMEEAPCTSACT